MEILTTIVTGVLSGIVASVCFYLMLKHIKPRIEISPVMCIDDSDPDNVFYRTKFVNRSKKVITKLQYILQYIEIKQDCIHTIKTVEPHFPKLQMIDKYDKKDKDSRYALRISYKIPNMDELNDKGNVKWIFTVIAEDPDSGTTTCVKQEFLPKNIVHGKHETGKSLAYVAMTPSSMVQACEELVKNK